MIPDTQSRIAVHAGRAGVAILVSRVIGLAREQTIAVLFGAGFATDAFNVAFRIPNLLRDLFTEGALPALFVPAFTERAQHGVGESRAFARQLMSSLFVLSLGFCVLGWVFAPTVCRLMAPGFVSVPGKLDLTVKLMRFMLPLLPAVTIAAIGSGVLNARSRFVVPALTPAMLSVGVIGGTLLFLPLCRAWGQPPIVALGLGVSLGGLLMAAFQLPALHALGFLPRLVRPRRHPVVLRLGALMLPATVGLAATNLHLFVSTLFATTLRQGSVSWLWFAYRLVQLPAGVIGAALATVSLTSLSRAVMDHDMRGLKSTLSATLRLVFALTGPAALWVATMARPIVGILYEHGAFGPFDTVQTARALQIYCIGLPAIAASGVFTRTFYALGDTATPVLATVLSGVVGIVLNLLAVGPLRFLGLEHLGMALSTSIAITANLVLLQRLLSRKIGAIEGRHVLMVGIRSLVIAVLSLVPSWIGLRMLGVPHGHLATLLAILASLGSSIGLAWWMMAILHAAELPVILDAVRSGLRRDPGPPLA